MEALFRKVLCPIDFSQVSIPAIELARRLALQNEARIFLLYVLPPAEADQIGDDLERRAGDELRAVARKWLEGKVAHEIVIRTGEPVATIIDAERELGVDIVVMATHGRTQESGNSLGSVTEGVVRHSTIPVLTLRPV